MIPIGELGVAQAAAVHTLITDIDDTLTTDGALTAAAYTALERLKHSGLRVIVTTGRPAGWCDHIARMWPVDAVVGSVGMANVRGFERQMKAWPRYVTTARSGEGFCELASLLIARRGAMAA